MTTGNGGDLNLQTELFIEEAAAYSNIGINKYLEKVIEL